MKHLNIVILFFIFALSAQAECLIRGVYFKAPKGAVRSAYIYDGKENHLMDIPSLSLSKHIKLPAEAASFIVSPKPVIAGEVLPEGSFKVSMKEEWKDVVILFSTDKEKPVFPIKANALDISTNVMKPGEIYWLNLSKHTVRARLGDQKIMLKPNSRKVSSSPVSTDNESYRVFIDCKLPDVDKVAQLVSTSWRYNKAYKQITFILPSPDSKYPRVNSLGFVDVKKPKKEESE